VKLQLNEFLHSLARIAVLADTEAMESMELQVNSVAGQVETPIPIETGRHHHDHEAAVATEGLSRVAQLRLKAQLKLIETLPVLGPFLETQAACACKAGCPTCATPTLGTSAWAATKGWFGKRFSRTEQEPEELPSLSEGRIDFVMHSAEATMPLPYDPGPTPEDVTQEFIRQQEQK
jgi:hypothetical protein